jgi:hypothetical protein
MKSLSCLTFVSMQLALHIDTALSVPIVKTVQEGSRETLPTLMSRAYPVSKRQDINLEAPRMKRAEVKVSKEKRSWNLPKKSSQDVEASSSQATKSEEKLKPISRLNYHAKSLGVTTKQIGNAWLHGPIRAATEVPVSGVIGAGHHGYSMCRSLFQCKVGEAFYHLVSIPGKVGLAAVTTATAVPTGVVKTLAPTSRAVYHVGGLVKHGVHDVYRVARGKEIDKNTDRQIYLQNERERPFHMRNDMKYTSQALRADNWENNAPVETKEEKKKRKQKYGGGDFNCMGCGSGDGGVTAFSFA